MGARVIKIEHPDGGDDTRAWGPPFLEGESAYYLSINRNKESVAVDFKTAGGRRVIDALLARADVLVENFRPGTLDRIGLGYQAVAARQPGIVYVSISGFGQNGPRRDEAGYDAVAQAEGGLMSITGNGRRSRRARWAWRSPTSPPACSRFRDCCWRCIARGAHRPRPARRRQPARRRHGVADVSGRAVLRDRSSRRARTGNRHMTIAPYDTFDTRDGVLVLAVGNDRAVADAAARRSGSTSLGGDAGVPRRTRGASCTTTALRQALESAFRSALARRSRRRRCARPACRAAPCDRWRKR